ncbi:hypothetical protein ATJ88_2039 [Isoptericola jiangsuensis]|uniref:Uncharacterized protein n=1 Tax=Isoptericola jiangsuensis TaxID=548579 RepID=A0A2A9EXB2_9MICO|nr:hypothetical protein ATJ88_2039 [Isoptericola jiangsuensis]
MQIRVANEYSVTWPLWGPDGMLCPGDLEIDPQLRAMILDWAQWFNRDYHYLTGWPSREDMERHRADGRTIVANLQSEFGREHVVILDYWETNFRNDGGGQLP